MDLKLAANILKWEFGPELEKVGQHADRWQQRNCPGSPRVTMAAFAYLAMPKIGTYRYQFELVKAFDCSREAMRKRIEQVRQTRRR